MGGYNDGGNNRPPSSPANGEDNNTAASNDQGNTTAVDIGGGNADVGTLSIVLTALNTLDDANIANDDDADAKDAAGKKTLTKDATMAGTGGGALALAVILPLRNDDIGSGPYNSILALSVTPHSCNHDKVPQHCWPSLVHAWTTMAPQRRW